MPANVQPNGNCELASPAIVLAGDQAFRVQDRPMVDGVWTIRLAAIKGLFATQTGTATWPNATVESGETYDVYVWVRHETSAVNPEDLLVEIDDGGGSFATALSVSQADDGVYRKSTFSFVAAGTTARFRAGSLTSAQAIQSQFWGLDAVRMEKRDAAMAIKLAERGVAAVVTLMKANFGTELAAIDTERADGITMDVPAAGDYYDYPKVEIAGDTVKVEVFEQEFESIDFYSDADAARAVYHLPVTIRVTHFNRANHSPANMVKRSRRYATGVYNVFVQTPKVDAADASIQIGSIQSTAPVWETDGEDTSKIVATRITLTADLRCEESYA